jgi:hypothetical protein
MARQGGLIDSVQGRQIAFFLFVSVQIFKLGQYVQATLLLEEYMTPTHLLVWCFMDIVFVLLSRLYVRPKINWIGAFLVMVGLCGINMGIIAWGSETELVADQHNEPVQVDQILNSTHIRGSHTVHVRPPVVAKFNPNATYFCISAETVVISPILIKGTPPFIVSFVRVDYEESEHQFNVELTNADSLIRKDGSYVIDPRPKVDNKRRVGLYGFPLTDPGIYILKSVKEKTGDEAKIVNSPPLVVSECPVITIETSGVPSDLCVDEEFEFEIKFTGVPPVSIFYTEQVGRNEKIVVIGEDEVQGNESGDENGDARVQAFLNQDIQSLRDSIIPKTESVSVKSKVQSREPHVFKIARVVDRLGNTVDFPSSATLQSPVNKHGTHLISQLESAFVKVEGHNPPMAHFANCDKKKIKTDYDPMYESAPSAKAPIIVEGSAPFKLEAEFEPDNGGPTQPVVLESSDLALDLTAYEPGVFKLTGIYDRYCKGSVQEPTECGFTGVKPPTFSFTKSDIKDSCVGSVGTNLELTFTGEAPFHLDYRVERKDDNDIWHSESFRKEFRKPRAELSLKPELEGLYRYVFEKVEK